MTNLPSLSLTRLVISNSCLAEEVANAVDQTGGRYEGEIKKLKKLTERLDAEKQHYRRLYERQLEVRRGGGGGDSDGGGKGDGASRGL